MRSMLKRSTLTGRFLRLVIPLAAMGIATTIIAFVLGIQMALANGTRLVLSRAVGSGVSSSLSRKHFGRVCSFHQYLASHRYFWLPPTHFFEQPLIQAFNRRCADLHLEISHSGHLKISGDLHSLNTSHHCLV
ncbi:hypothetical protein OH492_09415 [Vibrio chagasii]|nr:hypothetical protein [Vibrio chagasii]